MNKKITIAVILFLLPTIVFAASAQLIRVVDGDTIIAKVRGEQITIRLAGIDCPEMKQPGGQAAKAFTEKSLGNGKFSYKSKRWGKNNRRLATITTSKGKNLNILLVRKGHAWAYPKKASKLIVTEEIKAKKSKVGIWAGDPEPPWEYRAKKKVVKKSPPKPAQPKISLYGDTVHDIVRDPDGSAVGRAGSFNGQSTKQSADWAPNPVRYIGSSPNNVPSVATRPLVKTAGANPVCRYSTQKAKQDVTTALSKKYEGHYSTIKMLMDANMTAYRKLCNIPESVVSNRVLANLNRRYYPHFSTINMLYESNMKAYYELNQ